MKKAQIWYFDLILGLTIFILMLVVVFRYSSVKFLDKQTEDISVAEDAQRLSEALVSTGIPTNWTQDDAISLGVLSDTSTIDLMKVERLKNYTISNYDKTRFLTGIKSDYLLHFETANNFILNLTNQSYIGKPGLTDADVLSINPENKIILVRYIVYRHDSIAEIIAMKFLVWQE
jgi:hypothetical protein